VVTVAVAALLQRAVWPYIPPSPELLFFPAVFFVARVAGLRPAILSVVLSVPIIAYWFLPPYRSITVAAVDDILDAGIFVVVGILLSVLVDRLRRAEHKARVAIEGAPVPTALLANDGRILYANPALAEFLERDTSDLESTIIQRFVHPDDAGSFEAALDYVSGKLRAKDDGKSPFSARFISGGAQVLHAEGTINAMVVPVGEARCILQLVNVTRRRVAERERERALAALRTVVEECPIALLTLRDGGRIVEGNAAALAAFDGKIPTTLEEIALAPGRMLDREGRPLPDDALPHRRALRGERAPTLEVQIRHPDGRTSPLLVNAAPLRLPGDDAPAAIVAFQDISPMKELEQLRAQWNALVAHDLRQPINTIALRTQLLARQLKGAHSELELETIARAVRRLNLMVGDLLDASRLETRQTPLLRRDVDLDELVAESIADARASADGRSFDVHTHEKGLHVYADPDRLAQVASNLLSNAVKYGRASTPVRVDVGRIDGSAFVAVSNEGEGIARAEVPHVFERFRRTASAARSGIQGTGLGLYIVRELVTAHGGDVTCASEPGKTTTFRFTIPLSEHA
jgi:signal transduction histidine kinase